MAIPEKRKYKKNYLSQIIYQLMFEASESINNDSMKALRDELSDDYSELATIKQQGIILQNDGSKLSAETEDTLLWQIESLDKSHTIVVGKDSFAIIFVKYVNFREYEVIITKALGAFVSKFNGIKQINRLGLRYVNQIKPKLPMTQWSDYISSKLTDSFSFVEENKSRRSMHSIVIAHDEETLININYGVYNQYFPAPIVDREFILDIDAYTPSAIDVGDCSRLLGKFNKEIAIYFELSIEDKLRDEMEVIDA